MRLWGISVGAADSAADVNPSGIMHFYGIKRNSLSHKRPKIRSPSPPQPQGEMPLLIYFMAAFAVRAQCCGCPEFTDEEGNAISSNLITGQVDSVIEWEAEEAFDVDRNAL